MLAPTENIAQPRQGQGRAGVGDHRLHPRPAAPWPLIEAVRATGAAIRLIGDGDVAGVIHTTDPDETGIDIYLGTGGAPEGVLAAAALRCIGGQMQGRLLLERQGQDSRAAKMGISDLAKVYRIEEMAKGDVLFAATGVTDGNLLAGRSGGGNSGR